MVLNMTFKKSLSAAAIIIIVCICISSMWQETAKQFKQNYSSSYNTNCNYTSSGNLTPLKMVLTN